MKQRLKYIYKLMLGKPGLYTKYEIRQVKKELEKPGIKKIGG